MYNLKTNFDKFLGITKSFFIDQINVFDNFQAYPRNPKMSDCQIIALALTGESIGIDSENYFFGKLKSDHSSDFVNLIDRSNFNRRRKRLFPKIAEFTMKVSSGNPTWERVNAIIFPICSKHLLPVLRKG